MDIENHGLTEGEKAHARLMRAICIELRDTPLVLKGGTSLMLCYGLDRFSEDLDFDAPHKFALKAKTTTALRTLGATVDGWDVPKDKETVYRAKLTYNLADHCRRLKIEVSYRNPPSIEEVRIEGGIRVASLPRIIDQKLAAAHDGENPRSVARDLYDLRFLAARHGEHFSEAAIARLLSYAADPVQLSERYRPDYEEDPLVNGRVTLDDLALQVHERARELGMEKGLIQGMGM